MSTAAANEVSSEPMRPRGAVEDGETCEVCSSRHLFDIDHNEGWTPHETRLDDLSWLCWDRHRTKTRHDLGVEVPVGGRWFVDRKTGEGWHPPPDEPREAPDVTEAGDAGATVQAELFTLAD